MVRVCAAVSKASSRRETTSGRLTFSPLFTLLPGTPSGQTADHRDAVLCIRETGRGGINVPCHWAGSNLQKAINCNSRGTRNGPGRRKAGEKGPGHTASFVRMIGPAVLFYKVKDVRVGRPGGGDGAYGGGGATAPGFSLARGRLGPSVVGCREGFAAHV